MIQYVVGGVGLLVMLGGLFWWVLQAVGKSNTEKIVSLVDKLTPGDLNGLVNMINAPKASRRDVLLNVDDLMSYFEATGNEAGKKAVQDLILALYGTPKA